MNSKGPELKRPCAQAGGSNGTNGKKIYRLHNSVFHGKNVPNPWARMVSEEKQGHLDLADDSRDCAQEPPGVSAGEVRLAQRAHHQPREV